MSEGLDHLAGVYFNPDWRTSGRWWFPLDADQPVSPQDCVAGFKHGAASEVCRAIADLDALLASPMTEEELHTLWFEKLGGEYHPPDDGLTYRRWFAEVRRFLAE